MTTPVVFVADGCPHCQAALDFLRARAASVEVRNVRSDQTALVQLIALTGRANVPAIVVGNDILVGFDAGRLQEMLDATAALG